MEWDYKIDDEILFFDPTKTYELTGYIPIQKDSDIPIDEFTAVRQKFLDTGHYTEYKKGTKNFNQFWINEYKKCRNGYTVNGWTITGDNYFFLNYFQLSDLQSTSKAGGGRQLIFPAFYAGQYELFHYIELCKRLRLNAGVMKCRQVGYSEMVAAIVANSYNAVPKSVNIVTAYNSDHMYNTLNKAWNCLDFINDNTDSGFTKLSQVKHTVDYRRASAFKKTDAGNVEVGWMSQVIGIVADKPSKLRGYRADLIIMDEVGSNPVFNKTYIQANALVGQIGSQWAYRVVGGTSGDTKEALFGLKTLYYDPKSYGVLPYKHCYTQLKKEVLTAFFIPCTKIPENRNRFLHENGYVDEEEVAEYINETRAKMADNPTVLLTHCAEYPFNDTEAFSAGNINKFNKQLIAEQLTKIRLLKDCPTPEKGYLEYIFKNNKQDYNNIVGFKWIPNKNSNLQILEHPIWSLPTKKDEDGKTIWTPPEKMKSLYVIGVDGIDIGKSQTSESTRNASDFCAVVYKRVYGLDEPQIVAVYKDRPSEPREAYKVCLALAHYYNAMINIEATRVGLLSWCRERKQLQWFMRRPRAALSNNRLPVNRPYGTQATAAIIDHQTDLIANYVQDYCHNIWFEDVLEELNNYTDEQKTHFDIVASLGMACLADEEMQGVIPKQLIVEQDSNSRVGFYTDENGNRRWGVVQEQTNKILTNNDAFNRNYGTYKTSDPRLNS